MADRQEPIDPDHVVTEGELIAVIVISVLIFILLVIQIALLIYCFCRRRCAQNCSCCRKEKKVETSENRNEETASRRSDEERLIATTYTSDDSEKPETENINEYKPNIRHPPLKGGDDGEKEKDKGEGGENDPDDKGDPSEAARNLEEVLTPEVVQEVQEGPEDTDPRGKETEDLRGRELPGEDTVIALIPTQIPGIDEAKDPLVKPGPADTDPQGKDLVGPSGVDRVERLLDVTPAPTLIRGTNKDNEPTVKLRPVNTDPKGNDVEDPGSKDRGERLFFISDDEGTGDSTSQSSSTQEFMLLPGQPSGEEVPLVRDNGDIKGRGRKIRRPISAYSQGLPSGLPRFSLPPIGVIGAWTEDEDNKDVKKVNPKWGNLGVSQEEDQGYSDGSRRKGSDEDVTGSKPSVGDEAWTRVTNMDGMIGGIPRGADGKHTSGKKRKGTQGDQGKGKGEGKDDTSGGGPGEGTKHGGEGVVIPGKQNGKSKKKEKGTKGTTKGENGDDTVSGQSGKGGKGIGKKSKPEISGTGVQGDGDGYLGHRNRSDNGEDSGISESGQGDRGSSSDETLKSKSTLWPGDNDVNYTGSNGWPDHAGRFIPKGQWISGDAILDDLHLEDVEFDDNNQLIVTGELQPENDTGSKGTKVKGKDGKHKPRKVKPGSGSSSGTKGKQLIQDKNKNDTNKDGASDSGEAADGREDSYDERSDKRELGRPPIKDDRQKQNIVPGRLLGLHTGDMEKGKKKQTPVRLGRGLASDAILEEGPQEANIISGQTKDLESKKQKRGDRRHPHKISDGRNDDDSQESDRFGEEENSCDDSKRTDDWMKQSTPRNKQRTTASKDNDKGSRNSGRVHREQGDTLPEGEPDGGGSHEGRGGLAIPGSGQKGSHAQMKRQRQRRKKKAPKSPRKLGEDNDNSWDAYLEHDNGLDLLSPLKMVFFDSDDDYR